MTNTQPKGRAPRIAWVSVWTVVLLLACCLAEAQAPSCGAPPRAAPHRIKGGESFPPLPLPVTPLRRTERKRPPAPPILIGKLAHGKKMTGRREDGSSYEYLDWRSDPADAQSLLAFACPRLGIRYRHEVVNVGDFTWDPTRTPIVYLTGHARFNAEEGLQDKLRAYLQAGGTLIAEACCGSEAFATSVEAFIKDTYPSRRLAPLPPEHPLFSCFFDIDEVTYQEGAIVTKKDHPQILAVELGCRAAILFSRIDLSCGWDGHIHDSGARYEPHDAMRIGTNMLCYTLSNQSLGRFLQYTKAYHETGSQTGTDKFLFGQLIHQGDWDPDPSAVSNLLKVVNENTSINVKFTRRNVQASSPELFDVPFLYMTGHYDFVFTETEVENLRRFLLGGGFLLADACCGRKAFDHAFRREIARVIPGRELRPVEADDPLNSSLYRLEYVRYALREEVTPPPLLSITVDGYHVVVYSPVDLGNGWEGEEHPYVDGIVEEDSLKIGANAIMYALTH